MKKRHRKMGGSTLEKNPEIKTLSNEDCIKIGILLS